MVALKVSYHQGIALVSDADLDFGFLRLWLSVGHTEDVSVVGGLYVTHYSCDGYVDFSHISAVRERRKPA